MSNPNQVTVPVTQTTPISGLTQAAITSPSMPAARLEAEELGLPDSPGVRVLPQLPRHIQDDSDCEYDSDGNLHPTFDLDHEEGPLNLEENEVEPQVSTVTPVNDETALTPEIIDKMKVADLKSHLKERNQSQRGRKQELVERLKATVASGAPVIQNMTEDQRKNMGGQGFASLAHWEMMEPEEATINEEGLARAPTVPANEAPGMGADKKNYSQ